jgi:hypothetical protein
MEAMEIMEAIEEIGLAYQAGLTLVVKIVQK